MTEMKQRLFVVSYIRARRGPLAPSLSGLDPREVPTFRKPVFEIAEQEIPWIGTEETLAQQIHGTFGFRAPAGDWILPGAMIGIRVKP